MNSSTSCRFSCKHAARDEAGLDVAPDGQPREEVGVLENQAAARARAGDRLGADEQLAGVGASSPAMSRSSVDLPQPLGPTSETSSPAPTDSETTSSAANSAPFGRDEALADVRGRGATSLRRRRWGAVAATI